MHAPGLFDLTDHLARSLSISWSKSMFRYFRVPTWKPLKTVHFVVRSDSLDVGGFCLCTHLDCLI